MLFISIYTFILKRNYSQYACALRSERGCGTLAPLLLAQWCRPHLMAPWAINTHFLLPLLAHLGTLLALLPCCPGLAVFWSGSISLLLHYVFYLGGGSWGNNWDGRQDTRTGGRTGATGTAGTAAACRDHLLPLFLLISFPLCVPLYFPFA